MGDNYKSLNSVGQPKMLTSAQASQFMTANAQYLAPNYTAPKPPTNTSVVADYAPYTNKYGYQTLLHKPADQQGYTYNSSGYFTIAEHAYLPECTMARPRSCLPRDNTKFTTS